MPRAFLSYARKDGERPAAKIRERLAREASDIVVQQDRLLLEGGVGWWKQITEAIDSVEFLILVMTPAAIVSGNVQKEWRYARQQGVCVYPVKGAPDSQLQFAEMPRWMSKAHFFDLKKEWPTFVAHLRKGCDIPRVPFMAPDLSPYFVERPTEYEALKKLLLTKDRAQPVAITTALSGAGGFGKTTLAGALCHDEDILESFDDGILWVTLGKYGENVGDRPAVRVLNRARLHAEDLRVGGRRARRKYDVELFVETLDSLEDQYDLLADLEAKQMVDVLVAHLDVLGLDKVKELVPWMLRNAEGHELSSEFGQKRNTITTRFYRGMRKAAKAAGISWY